ncbi:hypothetical protein HHI36_004401 [Cryptolaemus montrouzieri]|uniref:Uncharacterized protein n=1 Tax=Cryptolaemus montrouzieri TaxID=559131 RepID=A0ABD2NRQ8_9CUCU
MKNKQVFDILKRGFSSSEVNVENYLAYSFETVEDEKEGEEKPRKILREPPCKIKWPRICMNDYLSDADLKVLNDVKEKKEIKSFIEARIPKTCKEPAKTIFKELMYTIIKFSRQHGFNLKQTGALLSHFYLTHMIFTSSYNIAAEKLYLYFKEIMLCHSVASPPDSLKIFSMDESKDIMKFFCRIYLRNLPLIRSMCLPNFAFYLDTFLEAEAPLPKKSTIAKAEKPKKTKKK